MVSTTHAGADFLSNGKLSLFCDSSGKEKGVSFFTMQLCGIQMVCTPHAS